MTNKTFHYSKNPFFLLGLEKADTCSIERLRAEYASAQAEVTNHPSVDGQAYVYGLQEALALAAPLTH